MNQVTWEISVREVSEVEAKVLVRYSGTVGAPIFLRGTLRGPYCEKTRTLPAEYPFRGVVVGEMAVEAVVTDPCWWSEELPHLYRAQVEAVCGHDVVDKYHGEVGLRRTRPARNFDGIK